ncbi:MAG: hypothetical protein C0608_10340 [Deltaproteobacteria bacterium]|nr:MAG: hypothetical protein C0608_10340 [Deltaproteobacteria bacterium]
MKEYKEGEIAEIGMAFQEMFGRHNFTAVVSLSWPRFIHQEQEIPEEFELSIANLVADISDHCGENVGCLGLLVPAPNGRLHAHFMLTKVNSEKFTKAELAWIARRRRANTKAEPIYAQKGIAGYIANHRHLSHGVGRYIPLVYGEGVLKANNKPLSVKAR